MRVAAILGLAGLIGVSCPAWALDKVTFGTNWLADPEAGGYYQAVVDGTFAKYGLDVTILPGGPMSNGGLLLISGKIEFYMGGDMLGDFSRSSRISRSSRSRPTSEGPANPDVASRRGAG